MKNNTIKAIDFPLKDFFTGVFKDQVFLVGGTIRDFLLYGEIGRNRDIDLIVTGHTYEQIESKLHTHGKTNTVGKSFAVVKFNKGGYNFDISIPRKDVKRDMGSMAHTNFIIESGPHISLSEDLQRRDFSCNSIAARLTDGELLDPFDGVSAIGDKIIRMTYAETFFDDPLRLLRGARFASVHRFTVDPAIYVQAREIPLHELSKERICEELFRLLLESETPSIGLKEYWRLTILEKLFPELSALTLAFQDAIFHPETDEFGHHTVWAHTLIAVDIAQKLSRQFQLSEEQTLALLLGTLLHDIGKPSTTRWEYKRGRMTVTSIGHDMKGGQLADGFLSNLKIETRKNFPLKSTIINLVKNHHRIFELIRNQDVVGFKAFSRLVRDLNGQDFLLLLLDFADRQSREPNPLSFTQTDDFFKWYLDKKEEFKINQDSIKPIVMGRHLIAEGVQPGKPMGSFLNKLYERQLDGEFNDLSGGLKLFHRIQEEENGSEKSQD